MNFVIKKLLYFIFVFLSKTCRHVVLTEDFRQKAREMSPTKGFITATFHEFSLTSTMSQNDEIYCGLISQSKDGEYAAAIVHALGHTTVRGSSTRGSAEAIDKILQKAREGTNIAITIDGPKGPRRVCKPGAVHFSRRSGSPIIPIVVNASRQWVFNSWDKFKLMKPFSTLYISYGEPIIVPVETDGEAFKKFQRLLESELERLDRDQREMGVIKP